LHEHLLTLSGVVRSDQSAHGQPPPRPRHLGGASVELFGELGDARVAALQQSKEHSHLCGGVLAMLEHLEHTVEYRRCLRRESFR
jgi:hypothetical protein